MFGGLTHCYYRIYPQKSTTYRRKAPIAQTQYVRRIDAQIAVRFCAICSIYMPKALGDILTVRVLSEDAFFHSLKSLLVLLSSKKNV